MVEESIVSLAIHSARVDARDIVSERFVDSKDKRDMTFLLTCVGMVRHFLGKRPRVTAFCDWAEAEQNQPVFLNLAREFDRTIEAFNDTAEEEYSAAEYKNTAATRAANKLGTSGKIPLFLGDGAVRPKQAVAEFQAGLEALFDQRTYMSNIEKAVTDEEKQSVYNSGEWSELHLKAKTPEHFWTTVLMDLVPMMYRRTDRYGELDTDELVRALCENLDPKTRLFELIKDQWGFSHEEYSQEFLDKRGFKV